MPEVIEALLDHGVAVDHRDRWQRTPLILAALHDRSELVPVLCGRGADVEAVFTGSLPGVNANRLNWTPLRVAASAAAAATVRALVYAGAQLHATDAAGHDALVHARGFHYIINDRRRQTLGFLRLYPIQQHFLCLLLAARRNRRHGLPAELFDYIYTEFIATADQ